MKKICILVLSFVLALLLVFGFLCLTGAVTMLLWNALASSLGWQVLTFWQATGIMALIQIVAAPFVPNRSKSLREEIASLKENLNKMDKEAEEQTDGEVIEVKVEVDVTTPDEDGDKNVDCKVTVNGEPAEMQEHVIVEESDTHTIKVEDTVKANDELPVDTTTLDAATAHIDEVNEVKVEPKKKPKRPRRKPKNTAELQATVE